MKGGLSIGELAREAGIGVETVRFYEREHLLLPPRRTRSNYRLYDDSAVGRLHFIRHAKELGFSLNEIRRLLRMSTGEDYDAGDFHDIAREKIAWIDERIGQLEHMRDILAGAVKACPGHGADKSRCPVLALFTGCDGECAEGCSCGKCGHQN